MDKISLLVFILNILIRHFIDISYCIILFVK